MTDEQIIKALENKINGNDYQCFEDYDILDLIRRQQTEIDRLKTEKDNLIKTYAECQIDFLMNFVRKLKCGVPQETGVIRCADIDNLVKEMVGAEQ